MKNKIAVNTEFFKRTQAKGEMTHVMRGFEHDKNVIDPSLTKENFGVKNSLMSENYVRAMKLMPDKTQNTLIDSVLVLPLDQLKQVQKDHPKTWKREIGQAISGMMLEMENEMGFMPIGFKFHLDEGSKDADGNIKLNTHAHLLFANVCRKDISFKKTKKVTQKDENGKAIRDPKKPSKYLYELDEDGKARTETIEIPLQGRSPLSLYQSRGSDSVWSKQQDIAAKHLKHLGFERGDSIEITKARHLSKEQHVKREIKNQEEKIKALKEYEKLIETRIDTYFDLKQAQDRAIFDKNYAEFRNNLNESLKAFADLPESTQISALESDREQLGAFNDSEQLKMAKEALNAKESVFEEVAQKKIKFIKP